LFIAKVILKTFTTQFHYVNRVLWQHIVLCKSTLLGDVSGYGVRSVLRSESLSLAVKVFHYATQAAHHSQTHS